MGYKLALETLLKEKLPNEYGILVSEKKKGMLGFRKFFANVLIYVSNVESYNYFRLIEGGVNLSLRKIEPDGILLSKYDLENKSAVFTYSLSYEKALGILQEHSRNF